MQRDQMPSTVDLGDSRILRFICSGDAIIGVIEERDTLRQRWRS